MLDIYYADFDTTVIPSDPSCLELAGSIDLEAHRSLAALFDKARQAGVDGRRRGYPVASFACVAGASCLAGAVMGLLRADGPASLCGSTASAGFGWNIAGGRQGSLTEELERLRRGCIFVLSGRTKVPAHRSHDSLIARPGTAVVA
ncbi:hypothetical protein [Rhizobium sp. NFACC06-2]|uniref:hypothetical protein n=1 Tax=Rhizobium sp. NFACC06-2 TaxID=1566264 RepID=UPI00122CE215|nr:hypothetical protein [Rhizobium sp. NFACC06-2]